MLGFSGMVSSWSKAQLGVKRSVIFRRRLHQLIGRNGCCAASS